MHDELQPAAPGGFEGDLDLGGMRRALKRRRSWIVWTTCLAFLASLIFVFAVKPRYTASAQVLIENQENFFTRPDSATANPTEPPDDAAVASQIQLLTSSDLARQAIASLKLADNPEFNPRANPGLFARLGALVGLLRSPSSLGEEDKILQNYFDRLTVFQVAKSRVLEIDFSSRDRILAARAANTIADLYIGVQIAAKRQQARSDASSLGGQVSDLQTRLAAAEEKAESFRASSGLLMGPNNMTLSSQQLADLNTQLATARTAESDAAAKAKLIRDAIAKGQLDQISDIANNELVRQISIQRVTLRAELALQSRTLLPQHPQIKELKAQLGDLDAQLRSVALTVARGLENDARIAEARYQSIQATLDQQKQTVGDLGVNEVHMRALDRNAKLIGDQLEATMTKYQEAAARETATSTPGDARVISRAIPPQDPSFPRKAPTLIFATLAGLVLSIAAALAAELLSGAGMAPEQAEDEAPQHAFEERQQSPVDPIFARLDEAFLDRAARFQTAPLSPNWRNAGPPIESGETLSGLVAQAAALARTTGKAAWLLALGAGEADEAGPWAVEIGRRLAAEGRTILVEMRSGLLRRSGLNSAANRTSGLAELVEGEQSFAQVIDRDEEFRLHFIVAGQVALRAGKALDIALDALGETYDHVVILAASIRSDPLTQALAASADLLALVDESQMSEAKILEIRSELVRAGAGEIVVLGAGQASGETIDHAA